MSYSSAITDGQGRVEYVLRIDGYPYLIASRSGFSTTPGGAMFAAVKTGLSRDTIRISTRARYLEVLPDTAEWTAVVHTSDSDILSSLRSVDAGASTVLSSTLSDSATTVTVTSTTGFDASGYVYVGGEPVQYSGTTATTFTGCTRGRYGASAQQHTVDTSIYPECEPEVTEMTGPLDMRRATLYAATYEDGALTTPERIWVGYVSGPVRYVAGEMTIPLAPTAAGLASGLAMGWIASGRLRGS